MQLNSLVFDMIALGVTATPGYDCARLKSFSLLDVRFADVAIEAKIFGHEVHSDKSPATIMPSTVETQRAFSAECSRIALASDQAFRAQSPSPSLARVG